MPPPWALGTPAHQRMRQGRSGALAHGKGGAARGGAAAAGAAVDVGGTNGRNLDDGVVVIDQGKEGYL